MGRKLLTKISGAAALNLRTMDPVLETKQLHITHITHFQTEHFKGQTIVLN